MKVGEPPMPVRQAFPRWSKLDLFASEFATSAGKTAGPAAVVAVGAAVSGHGPSLLHLAHKVVSLLGG